MKKSRNIIAGLSMAVMPLTSCGAETKETAIFANYECQGGAAAVNLAPNTSWNDFDTGIEDPSAESAILSSLNGQPVAGENATILLGCEKQPSVVSEEYPSVLERLVQANSKLEIGVQLSDFEIRSAALEEVFPEYTFITATQVELTGPDGPELRDGVLVTITP